MKYSFIYTYIYIFGFFVNAIKKNNDTPNIKVISMKPYMKKYCSTNNLYTDYDRFYCLNAFSDYPIKETTYDNGTYLQNYEYHYSQFKLHTEKINNKHKELLYLYQFAKLL